MKNYILIYLLISIILFQFSCRDREEGCLDIAALNFDVEADENCCCEYPSLILSVNHIFDSSPFRYDSVYVTSTMDSFYVKDLKLLFSEIHLTKSGVGALVDDTIQIRDNNSNLLELEDNFTVVKPNQFSYDIGVFSQNDTYDGVSLKLGLDNSLDNVIPDSIYQANHALSNDVDTVWFMPDTGYIQIYLEVCSDLMDETACRDIAVYNYSPNEFSFSGTIESTIGYNDTIKTELDYNVLFDGINFETDGDMIISNRIWINFPTSLTITN